MTMGDISYMTSFSTYGSDNNTNSSLDFQTKYGVDFCIALNE